MIVKTMDRREMQMAMIDDEDEDDVGLGASQMEELVEKHVGKYNQLNLTEHHLTVIDQMRHEERIAQSITVDHFDTKDAKHHRIDAVEESIGNVEQKTDMLKKQQGRGTTGSTTSEKSAERTTTLTVPSREHMRSLTGKYVSDDLGDTSQQLETQKGKEDTALIKRIRNAAVKADRTGLRSRGVFPVQLPSGTGGKTGIHKIAAGKSNAMFADTKSFLGHLDSVLGPLQQARKSRRSRKEIKGQWPFDE